jgi:hypothetical protein
MSINFTAVRVDNGRIILLDSNGFPGQIFGNQYAVAGVSGDCLIAVTKHGLVEEHKIENGNARSVRGNLGKSHDPVSIQVGSPGNFIIEKANGQSDVYSNRNKIRTTGEVKFQVPASIAQSPSTPSRTDESNYKSPQIPDEFLSGIRIRCAQVIKDPISGPWSNICFWIATIAGVVGGIFAFSQTAGNMWQHYAMLVGIPIVAVSIGFVFKNALAKIIVRSWYGLPAVIISIAIINTSPEIGIWFLLAAIILWIWPIWPLILIVFTSLIMALAAIGNKNKKF